LTETEDRTGSTLRGDRPPAIGALLVTVFVVQFLVAMDAALLNVALPGIAADLGFGATGLQWVVTAYLLTFAGFLLLGSRCGDLWGRRPVLLGGLAGFLLASILCVVAWSPEVLIAGRALQGLAAALIAPAGLAIVNTELPAGPVRKRAFGLWGAAGAGGGAVGVVASGVLTEYAGWRAVLLVNVPITVLAAVAAAIGVRPQPGRRGRLDVVGAVLVTLGVAAIVAGVSAAGTEGWGSLPVVGAFGTAAVLLAAFGWREARFDHPLMPLDLFRIRGVLGGNVFGFLLAAGQLAAFYFTSLYVQQVWHVPSARAGLYFLPFCVFVVGGIALSGRLAAATSTRTALLVLGLTGAAGLAGFGLLLPTGSFWWGVVLPSLLAGVGVGGCMIMLGAAATADVPAAHAGIAAGVLNSSRQLGGTVGLAALVTLAAGATDLGSGYERGLVAAGVVLGIGAVVGTVLLPRAHGDR
jgi:EmrB/QacA subfamily drug resistance transporter